MSAQSQRWSVRVRTRAREIALGRDRARNEGERK